MAQQLEDWHAQHSMDDIDPLEICERLEVCRGRLEHALRTLVKGAHAVEDPNTLKSPEKPMTQAWYWFLTKINVEETLNMFLARMPAQSIFALGSDNLDKDDLLSLPSYNPCKGFKFHAVYMDIVTGEVIDNIDGYEPYTGSATGISGIQKRLGTYLRANRDRKCPTGEYGRHLELISRKDVDVNTNLRVVAGFNPADMETPYILLFEQMVACLTGCFEDAQESL